MLQEHELFELNDSIPCRQAQIKQLSTYLDPGIPTLPSLVLYGTEATGKSLATIAVLEALQTPYAIVRSKECITGRHLLERTVLACKEAVGQTGESVKTKNIDGRCENLGVLAVHLENMLRNVQRFVLVFDGIDQQREAPPTLLPALARLAEIIPCLVTVFIVTAPRPRFLHLTGVPHIHFPPYDRKQLLTLIARNVLHVFPDENLEALNDRERAVNDEEDAYVWSKFCGAVYDSLGKATARDILSFRSLCEKLWLPFVSHIRDGSYGTRDFSRLMVKTRHLFQNESVLSENIVPVTSATTASTAISSTLSDVKKKARKQVHELPYFTRFLLIAAYLASYNPTRYDQLLFMRATERKKKKRRKGNTSANAAGIATPSGAGGGGARNLKHRKIQRRLLGAQPFVIERMLAIFQAIVPVDEGMTCDTDLMAQIATLAGIRLLVKTVGSASIIDAGTKWKVNVGWDYAKALAKSVRFEIEAYMIE